MSKIENYEDIKYIFVDMDNVLAKCSEGFTETYEMLYKQPLIYDGTNYDLLAQEDHLSASQKGIVYKEVFGNPGFWLRLKVFEDSQEVLEAMNNIFEIYILSKPFNKGSMSCTQEKLLWLSEYFPYLDVNKQVIFMADKSLIDRKNYILIDDHIENLDSWVEGTAIKFDQDYNLNYKKADYNVRNWNDIYMLFNLEL
jgi:5'(3')-deoxyribonucleotidase